jgi:Flp pilus assembly protein TadB
MKHVKSLHNMMHELHAKKQKKEKLHESEKIKHIIEKEIHDAHKRHSKAVRNYVIFFSIALLLLTIIYIYNPLLPTYVMFINIFLALFVFGLGVYLIHSLYKREISDYTQIEKHIEKLKR